MTDFGTATQRILDDPYNSRHYIARAKYLECRGFSDLAIGDLYKALLLTDEFLDDSAEYHEQACEVELEHAEGTSEEDNIKKMTTQAATLCSELCDILLRLNCLRSAYDFSDRGLRYAHSDSDIAAELGRKKNKVLEHARMPHSRNSDESMESSPQGDAVDVTELPDDFSATRVIYEWNEFEPARSGMDVEQLNAELASVSTKLEARLTKLPVLTGEGLGKTVEVNEQLGLFAKEDIAAGEEVLSENSILTANRYLHGELCDACSGALPAAGQPSFACPDCDEAAFCSEECLDAALSSYHPAVCETDAGTVAKDAKPKESADSLYFLLVARALAMAEHQEINPLALPQVKWLWGDFGEGSKLPFSFQWNIHYPFHVLEKMGVDIFAEVGRYDVWIFNTLFAKFRGVASGRVRWGDGMPEVSAVHPMWCLANHSCSPNVRWEWGGIIRFWARKPEELVRWGPESQQEAQPHEGIKKDQEIFSHYGDTSLHVTQRREWMRGALGGDCRCERCVWEAEEGPKGAA